MVHSEVYVVSIAPKNGLDAPQDHDQNRRTTTPVVTATQINPAMDRNSYNTIRQRAIQTNCDM